MTDPAHSGKFRVDVVWNLASLAVMGVCGIALNILVGRYYDAAVLGVFNQVFAAYIVFSQFAVGGIHYSVLKFVAERAGNPRERTPVVVGALAPAVLLAALFAAVFSFAGEPIASMLNSPGVARGIELATPGLFFFAVNKVLLAVYNGLSRMRAFAVLSGLRPVLMIAAIMVAATRGADGDDLPVIFTVAELIVFLCCVIGLVREFARPWRGFAPWIGRHVAFGARSFASGVLVELNTRVDVILLGLFTTDEVVGVYSFAAIIMEGLFQLLVVLRNNYNPLVVRLLHEGRLDELHRVIQRGKLGTYAAMVGVGILAVGLYPLGLKWVVNPDEFMASWPLFAILMSGVVLSAGYMPFNQMLLLAGRPGMHTLLITAVVAFNIVGNVVLIPVLGASGSAAATAASFVFYAVALAILARRLAGVRI